MLGRHCLRTYSVTQKFVTLSSAEAELMALVRASSEAIGMCQLAATWGLSLEASIFVDSSAALAVTHRRGCGKLRHVRIGHLWVQEAHAAGSLNFRKVAGGSNPADLLTKHLGAPRASQLCEVLGQMHVEGDADKRLQLRHCGRFQYGSKDANLYSCRTDRTFEPNVRSEEECLMEFSLGVDRSAHRIFCQHPCSD